MTWRNNISIKGVALSILLTLILIKIMDQAFLFYLPDQKYLFPPMSKAVYKTKEFDAVASINRFGFRGDETEISKGQILVIGDSTTFGWGLKDDDVWARLVEKQLKSSGVDLKVYNLGVPGTDTDFHIEVAEHWVKKLKPKFVVISVLIGDDFQQILEKNAERAFPKHSDDSAPPYLKILLKSAKARLKILFPGLYKFYSLARDFKIVKANKPEVFFITRNWGEESLEFMRDNKIHPTADILRLAAVGDINPGLFYLAAKYPNRGYQFWDEAAQKNSPASFVLAELTKKFSDLSFLIKSSGGKLIIFSMPWGGYVNGKIVANYRKYGFNIPENTLVSYKPEIFLEKLAKTSDALFVPSLTVFREHKGAELFFPLDGHPSPEGSRLIAHIISKALLNQIGTPTSTK